jgi:hypothetical protein
MLLGRPFPALKEERVLHLSTNINILALVLYKI